jgi:hypothetical protein
MNMMKEKKIPRANIKQKIIRGFCKQDFIHAGIAI